MAQPAVQALGRIRETEGVPSQAPNNITNGSNGAANNVNMEVPNKPSLQDCKDHVAKHMLSSPILKVRHLKAITVIYDEPLSMTIPSYHFPKEVCYDNKRMAWDVYVYHVATGRPKGQEWYYCSFKSWSGPDQFHYFHKELFEHK